MDRPLAGDAPYRDLFEQAAEGMFVTSPHGQYLAVNAALARIYGFESPAALIAHFHDIANQLYLDPQRRRDFQEQIRNHGFVTDFESQVRRRDGKVIWIRESAREVRDPDGVVQRYEGTVVDVTERKRVEAELRRARDAAEDAARLKGEFLATMSHELRTPMHGVLGMTALLLDTPLSPEQREYAETTRASAESLLGILNDILDFTQIEADRLVLAKTPFEVRRVLEDVVLEEAAAAREKGLELVHAVDAAVPWMLTGDALRLGQVLRNLVDNAIKFTEDGEVEVRVALHARRPDGGVVLRISVSDTGIGIGSSYRGSLYDAFSQQDGSMARRQGGMGLGLALARRLVLRMGGELCVDTQPERGSTFWFTVQLGASAGKRDTHAILRSFDHLHGRRGLVLDPGRAAPRVLAQQLRAWGLRVECCESAGAARARLRAAATNGDPFSIAFIDERVPDVPAHELVRTLQTDTDLGDLALVTLTRGGSYEASVGPALRLTKPLRPSELLALLDGVFQRGALTEEPSTALRSESSDDGWSLSLPASDTRTAERERILIVEDNAVSRKVALRIIEKLGFRVDLAVDGREAVDAVQHDAYAMILMDCQMPEMDGFEATERIRTLEQEGRLQRPPGAGRLPIVALTANAMDGDRERCLAAGMDDYLTKPVKIPALRDALKRWVGSAF